MKCENFSSGNVFRRWYRFNIRERVSELIGANGRDKFPPLINRGWLYLQKKRKPSYRSVKHIQCRLSSNFKGLSVHAVILSELSFISQANLVFSQP